MAPRRGGFARAVAFAGGLARAAGGLARAAGGFARAALEYGIDWDETSPLNGGVVRLPMTW
jgi:hypothetical protein